MIVWYWLLVACMSAGVGIASHLVFDAPLGWSVAAAALFPILAGSPPPRRDYRQAEICMLEAEQARRDATYIHWRCGDHVPFWRGPTTLESALQERPKICGENPTCHFETSDSVRWKGRVNNDGTVTYF